MRDVKINSQVRLSIIKGPSKMPSETHAFNCYKGINPLYFLNVIDSISTKFVPFILLKPFIVNFLIFAVLPA
jgi:hypothetical protein